MFSAPVWSFNANFQSKSKGISMTWFFSFVHDANMIRGTISSSIFFILSGFTHFLFGILILDYFDKLSNQGLNTVRGEKLCESFVFDFRVYSVKVIYFYELSFRMGVANDIQMYLRALVYCIFHQGKQLFRSGIQFRKVFRLKYRG